MNSQMSKILEKIRILSWEEMLWLGLGLLFDGLMFYN